MLHRARPFTLRPSKVTLAVKTLLAAGLLTIAGLFAGTGSVQAIIGVIAGAAGVIWFLIAMHPKAAYLTVTDDGIEYVWTFGTTKLRWAEVSRFGIYTKRHLLPPETLLVGYNRGPTGKPREFEGSEYVTHNAFDAVLPDNFGCEPSDLLELLEELRIANTPAPKP